MHSGFDEFIFSFTHSNFLITTYPELPFEIVARTFVLFSDKLSRNCCILKMRQRILSVFTRSDLITRIIGRILESYANTTRREAYSTIGNKYVWTREDLSSLQPPDRVKNIVNHVNSNICIYYPTAQSRLQITPEQSTNILWYYTVIWTVDYFVL